MAGGSKKKKKPAANPARGFATTSIASKPKLEQEPHNTEKPKEDKTTALQTKTACLDDSKAGEQAKCNDTQSSSHTQELHELSPEALEAQLELNELQNFVEANADRVKKEGNRQVSRLQTDRRLLRNQAEFLSVKNWLPDALKQHILELVATDDSHGAEYNRKNRYPSVDDLTCKIWLLRQCLYDLEFPPPRIDELLTWALANIPHDVSTSLIWGLEECLDWLATNCEDDELSEYDFQKQKSIVAFSGAAKDQGDSPHTKQVSMNANGKSQQDSVHENGAPPSLAPRSDSDGGDVSDIESDLDPQEMISIYLRTKGQLFELFPETHRDETGRGKSQKTKLSNSGNPTNLKSKKERKLEQKLQKLESDILFDKSEAEYRWASQRVEIAREAAERRRLDISKEAMTTPNDAHASNIQRSEVNDEAQRIGEEFLKESAALEDDDMLGGMFDALPGVTSGPSESNRSLETNTGDVTIRDFGKITGMSSKRVLEEACRARDSQSKLFFKLVSPTTYASRHSVNVVWNKEQEPLNAAFLPFLDVHSTATNTLITMTKVATPDVAQSENFISTAALFLIFSGLPKEEKAHLRLPSSFRNLWDEFAALKRGQLDEADREIVKSIRIKIESQQHQSAEDDEDEVVFNANSRRRVDGSSGYATPLTRAEGSKTVTPVVVPELQALWMQKSGAPAYQHMLSLRMKLPMFQFRAEALNTIQRHQVTILCGETGCGKSTQLPAFILENELANGRPCKIYCTEPRRISAISLAQRVSEEMGESKGDVGTLRSLVGYAIRLESHTSASTRLVYATTGIVLRMLESSENLDDITHLIIDEVHERSIDTDFLLIVLRSLLVKRADLKVVLMSATVDAQKFSSYLDGAPIISVPGRTFPVVARFLEDAIELTGHTNEDAQSNAVDEEDSQSPNDRHPSPDDRQKELIGSYSKKTRQTLQSYDEYQIDYSLITKLIEKVASTATYKPFSKAILVFLPGIAEIRQLNDMLLAHRLFATNWRIHPLHSSFSSEDQQAAFDIPPEGIRKIVLATNIAETGITIPDVTCVIDTGKHKEMRFDERRQMSRLIQSFIARANAKQRRGRAGRVQEGICFHLFTKHRHDNLMADQQTPEMLRLSLQDLVMRVKICKLGDIETALSQALDPPSSKNISRAIDALIDVGALTSTQEMTSLGKQLAKLPLDAQLGKLILTGAIFACLDFALTVAAILSSKSPFISPLHAKKQAETVRLGFKRGDSDLLTAYNAYTAWRIICTTNGISEYTFCTKNFLSPQNLANIEDLKGQLVSALADAGFVALGPEERAALNKMRHNTRQRVFVPVPARYCRMEQNEVLVTSVIAWSFYPKIVKQDGKGWRNVANNQSLGIHPMSVNKFSINPDIRYLSFYSIMQGASRFTNAQETSPVSDFALVLMAGDAVFHMYAGVIVIDGNRLRFKVRDWKTMIVLKILRARIKDVLAKTLKHAGRDLGDRPRRWLELFEGIFADAPGALLHGVR